VKNHRIAVPLVVNSSFISRNGKCKEKLSLTDLVAVDLTTGSATNEARHHSWRSNAKWDSLTQTTASEMWARTSVGRPWTGWRDKRGTAVSCQIIARNQPASSKTLRLPSRLRYRVKQQSVPTDHQRKVMW